MDLTIKLAIDATKCKICSEKLNGFTALQCLRRYVLLVNNNSNNNNNNYYNNTLSRIYEDKRN